MIPFFHSFDAEEGEAMSEGEVNDEEEEDPVEEERVNNCSSSRHHRKALPNHPHRRTSSPLACHPSQRTSEYNAVPSRHSPLCHNGTNMRERRRSSEAPEGKLTPVKRRRRSDQRNDYSRPRRSSPLRCTNRPAPVSVSGIPGRRRRFPSASGVREFTKHRTRHSMGFGGHRPPPVVYRTTRRSAVPQRLFVSRR